MKKLRLLTPTYLLYLFDANAEAKRRISQDIVTECFMAERNYSVSMQNLAKCAVVLTRKISNPIPYEDVCRLIHDITFFDG